MSGLSVDHVEVRYRGTTASAVADATFDALTGHIVGLVGPSGCGKSTLLAAIVGIVPLTSGRVLFDGADVDDTPVHRRGFGLVFQDGQLFPHRTVAGNVAFGLEMARTPATERAATVDELLTMVGLEGFGPRPVADLSGGERQRVALARSLAPRPRLLLLDEPFSSLDTDLRVRLGTDVKNILKGTGTTAVMVTHDIDEAQRVCDSIIRMADGVAPVAHKR